MRQQIIESTIEALKVVREPRFFRSERGYNGRFYCALQNELDKYDILPDGMIAEMEYQKSRVHDTKIRPDIVIHVDRELSGATARENNFAVYELKRKASICKAREDFDHLDKMFKVLNYPLGFFINIDSDVHHLQSYTGIHPDKIHAFAVKLVNSCILIKSAYFDGGEMKINCESVSLG